MRPNSVIRSGIVTLLLTSLAACDSATVTAPSNELSAASMDRVPVSSPTTARPQPARPVPAPTPARPVAKRPTCRPDTGLTQDQIAKIRALQEAYQLAVADDLRLIAAVEAEAREAAANGASREKIAAILAKADRAKAHVAELQQRLRQAINQVLTDDQRYCVATTPRKIS